MSRAGTGPPDIAGYTPLRLIGSGGYADVYTYTQRAPRRVVAIKVLAPPAGQDVEQLARSFEAEANYLAELSQHPSIVTVHAAGISRDGRPFMAMEYCARPGLGALYRRQRFAVAEVLRIGIRLTSAVETAHRAGVLHRDIKPANVLITDFGWPALADFGIAAAIGDSPALGVSVPWTAPEVLQGDAASARSDVYSLAATLYALLAQRSPFEDPGGDNEPYELMARIERGRVPPLGRPDVPASLEALLVRALGPASTRPGSAAELGRALQQVERELSLAVTDLDLPDSPVAAGGWLEATVTRPRMDGGRREPAGGPDAGGAGGGGAGGGGAGGVGGSEASSAGMTGASAGVSSAGLGNRSSSGSGGSGPGGAGFGSVTSPGSVGRPASQSAPPRETGAWAGSGIPPWEATRVRPIDAVIPGRTPEGTDGTAASRGRVGRRGERGLSVRASRALGAVVLVLVLAVGAAVTVLALRDDGQDTPQEPSTLATIQAVPTPIRLDAERTATGVRVTWVNPEPLAGDQYAWSRTPALGQPGGPRSIVSDTSVEVSAEAGEAVCVAVVVVRSDGATSQVPGEVCADG